MVAKSETKNSAVSSAAVWVACALTILCRLSPGLASAANNPVPYIGSISPVVVAPAGLVHGDGERSELCLDVGGELGHDGAGDDVRLGDEIDGAGSCGVDRD